MQGNVDGERSCIFLECYSNFTSLFYWYWPQEEATFPKYLGWYDIWECTNKKCTFVTHSLKPSVMFSLKSCEHI